MSEGQFFLRTAISGLETSLRALRRQTHYNSIEEDKTVGTGQTHRTA
jgi:hypothetical protein